MLFQFLWGKRDKIKQNVMINSYQNCGLKMIDIESHFHALKAAWITRIYNGNDNLWTVIPLHYIEKTTMGLFTHMNVDTVAKLPQLQVLPKFYQEVIIGYMRSNKPLPINSKNDLYNQFLWGNRLFVVSGKCIFSRSFINAGIYKVGDVLLKNGFINENVYHTLLDKKHFFRTISLIKSALKPYKELRFKNEIPRLNPLSLEKKISKRKCKYYYDQMVQQKCLINNCANKWSEKLHSIISLETIYKNKLFSNFEVYITEFNFKLFNCILPTGNNLFKWNKKNSAGCIYCDEEKHDERHLLYKCPHLKDIWVNVGYVMALNIDYHVVITGEGANPVQNQIISLLCWLLFKKFIKDINVFKNLCVNQYLKNELNMKLNIYKKVITNEGREILRNVIDSL